MRNKPYLAAFCMIMFVAALGSGCGKQQTLPEEETGFAEQGGEQAAGEEAKQSVADEDPEMKDRRCLWQIRPMSLRAAWRQ